MPLSRRQDHFSGHEHHESRHEARLGGSGEKMHSEVPHAA